VRVCVSVSASASVSVWFEGEGEAVDVQGMSEFTLLHCSLFPSHSQTNRAAEALIALAGAHLRLVHGGGVGATAAIPIGWRLARRCPSSQPQYCSALTPGVVFAA
jgi:hypothetical protein